MFCSECGQKLEGQEICPSCGTSNIEEAAATIDTPKEPVQTNFSVSPQKSLVSNPMNMKTKLTIGGIILVVLVVLAFNKITGPSTEVKKYIIGDSIFLGNQEYVISKDFITGLDNIKKTESGKGLNRVEEITADLKLNAVDFKADGKLVIYKRGQDTEINYNLKYVPLIGVTKEQVEEDILNTSINLDDLGQIYLSDANITKLETNEIKENLESNKCQATIDLEITNDLFITSGQIEAQYSYDNGLWQMGNIAPKSFTHNYVEGKDLQFSLTQFIDEYNRGRLYLQLADNKVLSVALEEAILSLDKIEQDGLYDKIVHLNINKTSSFYTVTGKVSIRYTYNGDTWAVEQVILDPDYTFNITGKYNGWYELNSYYETGKRTAQLEISKVNNKTGEYDGIFSFQTPEKPEESGSYYVTGSIQIMQDTEDEWSMKSEKWIQQPEGFYMVNLEGILDNDNKILKGKNTSYSDTFELVKSE